MKQILFLLVALFSLASCTHYYDRWEDALYLGNIQDNRYSDPYGIFSIDLPTGYSQVNINEIITQKDVCWVQFQYKLYDLTDEMGYISVELDVAPPGYEAKLSAKELRNRFMQLVLPKKIQNLQECTPLAEEIVKASESNSYLCFYDIKKTYHKCGDDYLNSVRGYLLFQEKDLFVILAAEETYLPGSIESEQYPDLVERLKSKILNARASFKKLKP